MIFFLGLVIVFNSIAFTDTPSLITTVSIFSIFLIVNYFVFYYLLVPDYLVKRSYGKFILYAILVVFVLFPGELLLWYGIFYSSIGDFPSLEIKTIHPYLGSVLGALFCGGLAIFFRFGSDWFNNQQVMKDLENKI